MRVRFATLHLGTAELHRQHPGCMGQLFRKVDLEMSQDLSAGRTPPTHSRVLSVFHDLPTVLETFFQAL